MTETHALAPLPQRTLDGWHRFVASGEHGLLASLQSKHTSRWNFPPISAGLARNWPN
jgi:hypothetical protein